MLKIKKLSKVFTQGSGDEVRALKDMDLSLDKGDFATIIGSNGAGKSTLLDLIAGSIKPTAGRINIAGETVNSISEHKRANFVGRVFQEPGKGTAPGMTVAQNLSLALNNKDFGLKKGVTKDRKEFFRKELKILGLGLEKRLDEKVYHLSGGERQGVAVLMATLDTPKLLLLDEHTASLDPKNAEKILEITGELIEDKNLTTIMVTHDMKQALSWGNKLVMLHRGSSIFKANGRKKEELTIEDLLEFFSKRDVADDEMLLGLS